ncbi:hypothetical protein HAX54_018086, partial [Datura stramonium]|nr:hypothetical protein [Datura stramonium]
IGDLQPSLFAWPQSGGNADLSYWLASSASPPHVTSAGFTDQDQRFADLSPVKTCYSSVACKLTVPRSMDNLPSHAKGIYC